jgi:hypothetical protein
LVTTEYPSRVSAVAPGSSVGLVVTKPEFVPNVRAIYELLSKLFMTILYLALGVDYRSGRASISSSFQP